MPWMVIAIRQFSRQNLGIYGVSRDLKRLRTAGASDGIPFKTIVNCQKQTNQMKSLTKVKGAILGIAGIAVSAVASVDRAFSKTFFLP